MRKKLFNCAVLYHPEKGDTQIVKMELGVLAADSDAAQIEILRNLPMKEIENTIGIPKLVHYPSDQLEVIVRPF